MQHLQRTNSSSSYSRPSTRKVIPSSTNPPYFSGHLAALAVSDHSVVDVSDKLPLQRTNSQPSPHRRRLLLHGPANGVSSLIRSLFRIVSIPLPACKWLPIPIAARPRASSYSSLGRKVTGTLYGHRRGHVSFAVQDHPGSDPVLILDLAMSTSALVKEMASGLVRIALECEKTQATPGGGRPGKLFQEPMWTMYCNGRKCGCAVSRACSEPDWHVLRTVHRVSVGAGVIPVVEDGQKGGRRSEGELLYMRAKFERVVGSRDSEAFYMLNPDGNGGPELSIFLLRL
ncbi:hypothetical protein SAY86_024368 [Trapa natans]|uniref:Protein MIZU-KUSSEI 1 n=1 Tax=Trapa natans TaxID=22666 RepID=A0AAN7LZ64_TRANT|nr:hypothetical protein SAY86_024368 [Trapa natans]